MTDYVTLEDFRAWLSSDDTRDDNLLQVAVTSASFWIDQRCGRTFGPAGELEARTFRPTTGSVADVDDIATTTGLIVATSSLDDGVYDVTWTATDYLLEPLNGRVNGVGGWPYNLLRAVGEYSFPTCSTRPSLSVTARFGWPAVPADIAQACRLRANYEHELRRAALGVAGFGDFGALRVRDLPVVEQLLMPYRNRQVLVSVNLNDVADGIDGLLAPIGIRASVWRPNPQPPCVLVVVDTLTNWTFEDFQEAGITLILIAGEVGTEAAIRAMNDYLDLEHEDSIVHALRADPTLGGTVGSSDVTDIRNYTPLAVDPQNVKHTYVELVLVVQGP